MEYIRLIVMPLQLVGIVVPIFSLYILATRAQTRTAMHLAIADLACVSLNCAHMLTLFSKSEEAVILGFRLEYFATTVFILFFTMFFLRYLRVSSISSILMPWIIMAAGFLFCLFSNSLCHYVFFDVHIAPASVRIGRITYFWYTVAGLCLIASFTFMSRRLHKTVAETERKNQFRIICSVSIVILSLLGTMLSRGRIDCMPLGSSLSLIIVVHGVLHGEILGIIETGRNWILENMDNAFVLVDSAFGYLDANEQAKELFPELSGLTRNKPVGKDVLRLIEGDETYYDLGDNYYEKRFRSLQVDGEIVGYALLLVDVTEQLRAMSELTILKKLAEDASREKSDFLSNMSHEIRTPMNAIVGLTDLLLREDWPAKEYSYLQSIKHSGNALLNIINDILDISKMESGKFRIIDCEYDMFSVLNDLGITFLSRIGSKDVQLLFDIDPTIPSVLDGDSNRLRQILINLLGNAVKFTENGYVKLVAKVSEVNGDELTLYFAVEDSGIGIKQKDFDRLFSNFSQVDTKRNREKEGTGLGLAISKKLVELLGGTIQVSSQYGKGSTFSFTIKQRIVNSAPVATPIPQSTVVSYCFHSDIVKTNFLKMCDDLGVKCISKEELRTQDADFFFTDVIAEHENKWIQEVASCGIPVYVLVNPMREEQPSGVYHVANFPIYSSVLTRIVNHEELKFQENNDSFGFSLHDTNILVVDDNELNLKVAEGILRPTGASIDVVRSGADAILCVKQKTYDIIFMDHMMPIMDGVEATAIIRNEGVETPIVALTANVLPEAQALFLDCGMNGFLAKPFKIRDMGNILKKFVPDEKFGDLQEDTVCVETAMDPRLSGLDATRFNLKAALANAGTEDILLSLLEDFYKLAPKKASVISKALHSGDIKRYIVEVHSMKSSARLIGALDLSEQFSVLESQGKEGNLTALEMLTPAALDSLQAYAEELAVFGSSVTGEGIDSCIDERISLLEKLDKALYECDIDAADSAIGSILKLSWSNDLVQSISELELLVKDLDSDGASKIINDIIMSIGENV